LNDIKVGIGMIVQVSGKLTAQRPNNDEVGITAFFRVDANAIESHGKATERIDIPEDPSEAICDLLSSTPHNSVTLPKKINVNVYLKSACIWTLHKDTGTNPKTDPCYKIEFHAGILEGDFKGLSVLVTRIFQPVVINPFNDVQIDIGMIVQVSGMLTAQRQNDQEAGLTAFFHIDADTIKRDISHSNAREQNDEERLLRNPLYTPKRRGAFSC
jgi:hypothetical protein